MDLRVKKTERSIQQAFLDLRRQKPLEKITVKELCQRADIHKSTFYSHYEDLYALFVALFNDKPELVSISVWALRIYAGGIFMLGVQFACQQTFVALGETRISLFLALLRKVILLIPLILILPRFFSDQVFGVFLAEPVADVAAAAVTGTLFFWRFPKIMEHRRAELAQIRPQP